MPMEAREWLALFGYEMLQADEDILEKLETRARQQIKADCNLKHLPEALEHAACEMAAGAFLAHKKAAGALTEMDAAGALKSLQEGDTTVAYYEGESKAEAMDRLLAQLTRPRESLLARYRRVAW